LEDPVLSNKEKNDKVLVEFSRLATELRDAKRELAQVKGNVGNIPIEV